MNNSKLLLIFCVMAITSCMQSKTTTEIAPIFSSTISWNKTVSYSSFTDTRDGQVYKCITIGDQTWMAENLNYKGISPDTVGHYYNDNSQNSKFGRLYSWSEVMGLTQKYDSVQWNHSTIQKDISPSGWHIPTDSEWNLMLDHVNSNHKMAGILLRSTNCWLMSDSRGIKGIDSLGFRILPAGSRFFVDSEASYFDRAILWVYGILGDHSGWVRYEGSRNFAYFWSSTEENANTARYRVFYADTVQRYSDRGAYVCNPKRNSFSVRCVKDK